MGSPEFGSSNPENRITIPAVNWHIALANAVRDAGPDTVIVVDSEAKKDLANIAAERMGKQVTVEIENQ